MNLHPEFPGGLRQSPAGYPYYLVGDIFGCGELRFGMDVYKHMEDASLALGRFASLIERLPSPDHFIAAYFRKEAVLSSRIEGTQTQITEAFMDKHNIAREQRDDWDEFHQYTEAIGVAQAQMQTLPLCNRVIKQAHGVLLSQVRGQHKSPGEFRRSQNWIGGSAPSNAHFVPPTAEHIDEAMSNLERFMQDETLPMPHLIKAALMHYQFETIHPFLDGNGRIGRMLIVLYLLEKKVLKYPILYISSFFEKRRSHYYGALDRARTGADGMMAWVLFFLQAVAATANDGIAVTQNIIALKQSCIENKLPELGRRAKNGMRLLELLFAHPVINAKTVRSELSVSPQSAQVLLASFQRLGIVECLTPQARNRLYVFAPYIALLDE